MYEATFQSFVLLLILYVIPTMVPRQDAFYNLNMSCGQYNILTIEQVEHFIRHGWIKLSNCFTRKQADEVCANVWNRLRMDQNDMTTWHTEWQALPGSRDFEVDMCRFYSHCLH